MKKLIYLVVVLLSLVIVGMVNAGEHYVFYNTFNGMVCIGLRQIYTPLEKNQIHQSEVMSNDRVCYGPIPFEWQIVKTGVDWNGDGHPDILWKNVITNRWSLWFMNGPYLMSYIENLEYMGPEWVIK